MSERRASIFEDRRGPASSARDHALPWGLVGGALLTGVLLARMLERRVHGNSGP